MSFYHVHMLALPFGLALTLLQVTIPHSCRAQDATASTAAQESATPPAAALDQATGANQASVAAMDRDFVKAIKEFEESLTADGKAVYNGYLARAPLPNQRDLLIGQWHGKAEDADNRSHWRYERKADGSLLNQAVDIDLVAMEYTKTKERREWLTRGRVMYEFIKNATDDQEPLTVFLLDGISPKQIEYQIIFADESPDEWIRDIDREGPGPPIKLSEEFENSDDL
ncbi:hypothetical protein [Rubripirellula amarantea]|uniref:hypothetical protein n=1 Tax=Rubripirellula amarantea TaxID=2527999 RepID=UPI0011B67267|nr:hypothetical protein [Rubripirellula amarantea]